MSHQQGSWEQNPIVRDMLRKPHLTRPEIMGIFAQEDVLVAEVDEMLREYDSYHEALAAAPPKEADGPDPHPRHAPHVQRREGVFRFVDDVREQLTAEVAGNATGKIVAVNPVEHCAELTRILKGASADAFLEARRPVAVANDLLFDAANGNIRFIARVAARQVRRYHGAEFYDLLHEGVLGGVHAGKRYNQFSGSYLGYAANWIRQFMQKYVFDTSRVIRVPGYRWRQLTPILRVSNRLWHETGSVPIEELARRVGLTPQEISDCVEAFSMHASLQGGFSEEDDDRTLADVVASDAPSPQDSALDRLLAERLREEVSRLAERERYILTRYFGLDGKPVENLPQIAARFGCTRENIRQIKERALGRLRLQLPLASEDVPY